MNSETGDFGATGSAKEPFSEPLPKLDQLMSGVRALEQFYAADFERRLVELTELLRKQITAELRSEYSSELNQQVETTKRHYDERLRGQCHQAQHKLLEKENEELKQQLKNVSQEIAATEAMLTKYATNARREAEYAVSDAASLGKLLQVRLGELEMRAYLNGLRFAFPRK